MGCRNGRRFNWRPTISTGRDRVNAGGAAGARCAMVRHCWRNAMNDPVRPPRPDELDPIETASRDEIAALQLDAAARDPAVHAYDNVAHYKTSFDDAGVSPADLRSLDDVAQISVHGQGRSPPQLSLRPVCGAPCAGHPHPCLERHHRHPHCGRLHEGRPRHVGRARCPLPARRRRAPRRHGARRLRLRALHRRPRPPCRRRESWAAPWSRRRAGSPSVRSG